MADYTYAECLELKAMGFPQTIKIGQWYYDPRDTTPVPYRWCPLCAEKYGEDLWDGVVAAPSAQEVMEWVATKCGFIGVDSWMMGDNRMFQAYGQIGTSTILTKAESIGSLSAAVFALVRKMKEAT